MQEEILERKAINEEVKTERTNEGRGRKEGRKNESNT